MDNFGVSRGDRVGKSEYRGKKEKRAAGRFASHAAITHAARTMGRESFKL